MRAPLLGPVVAALTALTASLLPLVPATASAAAAPAATTARHSVAQAHRPRVPGLRVRRLVTGLDHPWDVKPVGRGRLPYTERDRATLSLWDGARHRVRGSPSGSVWVSGETGLLGLGTATGFRHNHTVYTCQGGTTAAGRHDVRVLSWHLNDRLRRVVDQRTLLTGLPATSGRHGGCRLLAVADRLYVGPVTPPPGPTPRACTRSAARHSASSPPPERRAGATRSSTRATGTSATCTPTATATCRGSTCAGTPPCGRSSRAPIATTR